MGDKMDIDDIDDIDAIDDIDITVQLISIGYYM